LAGFKAIYLLSDVPYTIRRESYPLLVRIIGKRIVLSKFTKQAFLFPIDSLPNFLIKFSDSLPRSVVALPVLLMILSILY
jgi:hypothetical protein